MEFGKICYDMGLYLDDLEREAAMHKLDTGKDGYVDLARRVFLIVCTLNEG